MAEPPPPPPPFQPPPFARKGRSGRAWNQRSRPPMGLVPVNRHGGLSGYGNAYFREYPFVRPGFPQPQMGGNRFMETTSEVAQVQRQRTGLVNHGTGVFHPHFPTFHNSNNVNNVYTVFHPRVPFVYTNGANNNKDNKGKKMKLGAEAEASNQISTTKNASGGTSAAGGSVKSHEHEPSSEIDFLPDEWTY